jgi:serine/threonine-protein kinase
MLATLLALTPVFLAADWAIARHIEPSALTPLLIIRVVGQLGIVPLLLWLYREAKPSHQALLRIERLTTAGFALMSSLLCVFAGGIASIYAIGITIILVGRSTMRTDRSADAAPSMVAAVAMHPLVIGVGAIVSPDIASQLSDMRQLALFGTMVATNLVIMMLVLTGGDTIWQLRRQLFAERQLGRYQLKHLLGAGGMGEVWSAYFPPLHRNVAVKILKGVGKTEMVARFEREARATAELAHPNTVRVFDFGVTEDGLWYYAMELLDGENLAQLVRREGPIPAARAVHLVSQATRALAEAHAAGIVHRDIKPENLFLTELGGETDFVKLLDFGIAALTNEADTVLTEAGTVMGTPLFLPPEMANGRPADARSDVYSMGAVLYFLLTGQPPYSGESLMALLSAIVNGGAPRPSELLGQPLAAELEAIVMRSLALDPDERFADAGALARAFADLEATP